MSMKLLTNLKKFLRVPRPNTGTWQEWEEWEIKARKDHPIRYFLFDTMLTKISVWNSRYIGGAKDWIRYRTYNRFHVISPKTLKPGYHNTQERILHAAFGELVSYVEGSLGYRGWPWQLKKQPRKTKANLKKYGLEYLEWEINDPTVPAHQKEKAKEIKALYHWWTEARPKRIDHLSPKMIDLEDKTVDLSKAKTTASIFSALNNSASRKYYDYLNEVDQFYADQDQKMLEALIDILDYLD